MPLLPNAERAIIEPEKLRDYLLNRDNLRNGGKWRLFYALGYTRDTWVLLARDLREQHLSMEASEARSSDYGIKFEIRGVLHGPSGSATIRSFWQYDEGSEVPRFISAYGRR